MLAAHRWVTLADARNPPYFVQLQRHIHHAGQRIVVVRRDRHETEIAIERAGRTHRGERIEQHGAIAALARDLDQFVGKLAAKAAAAKRRPHIEPLHLAHAGLDHAVRDRAGGVFALARDQHHAARPCVFARQRRELVIDILEADVFGKRGHVFAEQRFDRCAVVRPARFGNADLSHRGRVTRSSTRRTRRSSSSSAACRAGSRSHPSCPSD